MLKFRRMKTLYEFASIHGSVTNHFNQERHLISREQYKERRSAALAEWRSGGQSWPKPRVGLGELRPTGDKLPLD